MALAILRSLRAFIAVAILGFPPASLTVVILGSPRAFIAVAMLRFLPASLAVVILGSPRAFMAVAMLGFLPASLGVVILRFVRNSSVNAMYHIIRILKCIEGADATASVVIRKLLRALLA